MAQFAYNNSFYLSIDIALFEAMNGRRYKSLIGWFDSFEMRVWGTDLNRESLEKDRIIQDKFIVAQSRKNKYVDQKVRDIQFMEGEKVLFKISPLKNVMNFGNKVNLAPDI